MIAAGPAPVGEIPAGHLSTGLWTRYGNWPRNADGSPGGRDIYGFAYQVDPGSLADAAGVRPGDVMSGATINGGKINPTHIKGESPWVYRLKPGDVVEFEIRRPNERGAMELVRPSPRAVAQN